MPLQSFHRCNGDRFRTFGGQAARRPKTLRKTPSKKEPAFSDRTAFSPRKERGPFRAPPFPVAGPGKRLFPSRLRESPAAFHAAKAGRSHASAGNLLVPFANDAALGTVEERPVESLDAAIDFIAEHGSNHTDAIITNDLTAAERFLREVDSGSVMVNCSTRLADGFEYGLGAEIGISTGKLHARGPVGLEGLTSLKYIVLGHGEGRR